MFCGQDWWPAGHCRRQSPETCLEREGLTLLQRRGGEGEMREGG